MNRDVILLTGQSGINKQKCVEKLIKDGFKPPIAVEGLMKDVAGKNFLSILADPPRVQETIWTAAFGEVKGILPKCKPDEPPILITFHASYYHQRKTEFLSPVDFREVAKLKDRVKMVVVFIDDCYDIYKRLMKEGEMFGYILERAPGKASSPEETISPEKALLDSITKNILTILEWREVEIAFSRTISRLLGVPLYIMAVKHPWWMLSRLIKSHEEQHIFYLSHPISSIRGGTYPRLPGFYEELCGFVRKMLARDNVVLFIPDTIDEKRIRKDRSTGKYVPEPLEGWPLPFPNEWLFTPLPSEVKDKNPLNPLEFNISTASDGFQTAVSLLLEGLLEKIKIGEQINSRDLSLVEQSTSGVVVYRPFWTGVLPGGVKEELKYNFDLATEYDETTRKAALFGTSEDLAKWRIKGLFNQLKDNIVLDDTQKTELHNLGEDWVEDEEKVSKFLDIPRITAGKEEIKRCIEQVLPNRYKFKEDIPIRRHTTLAVAPMLAEQDKQKDCWEWIFDSISGEDPFRQKYVVSERDVYRSFPEKEFGKTEIEDFIDEILGEKKQRCERSPNESE